MTTDTWTNNKEIKIFQEYLQIPSVHPNIDYGEWFFLASKCALRNTVKNLVIYKNSTDIGCVGGVKCISFRENHGSVSSIARLKIMIMWQLHGMQRENTLRVKISWFG